jgi:hypothetical protein
MELVLFNFLMVTYSLSVIQTVIYLIWFSGRSIWYFLSFRKIRKSYAPTDIRVVHLRPQRSVSILSLLALGLVVGWYDKMPWLLVVLFSARVAIEAYLVIPRFLRPTVPIFARATIIQVADMSSVRMPVAFYAYKFIFEWESAGESFKGVGISTSLNLLSLSEGSVVQARLLRGSSGQVLIPLKLAEWIQNVGQVDSEKIFHPWRYFARDYAWLTLAAIVLIGFTFYIKQLFLR